MNIIEIVPKDNYVLYIKTEDGKTGLFDIKPYLESEAFAPIVLLLGAEALEPPVVKYQQIGAGDAFKQTDIAAVAPGEFEE